MYRRHIVTFFGVLLALGLLMAPLATASSTNGDVDSPHSLNQASNIAVDGNQNDKSVIEAAPPSAAKLKFEQVDVEPVDSAEAAVYIIRLQDPPLTSYQGGVRGLAGTSPAATGKRKVDARSPESVAYLNYLDQRRAQAIGEVNRELGRSIEVVYEYKASLNGFAAKMTAAEAAQVAQLPSVQHIEREIEFELHTDTGPAWVDAPAVWGGSLEGVSFKADLSGSNEVPPVTDTLASGMATFSYDVTSGKLDFHIEVSNIMSITKAHIHSGTIGINGPSLYWLYDETGTNGPGGEFGPDNPITGTLTVSDEHKAQLWNGDLYVNIHTTNHPSGEVRGQIQMTGTMGENVIVGVIDTGIDPWNPSFADVGHDGYDHSNPRGEGNYVGVCDSENTSPTGEITPYDETFPCNDKLIGAWGYGTVNEGTPRDSDGHGSHTASTAAGNVVINPTVETPSETFTATMISGVAPHANVIAYAACCTGSALTAAIDQVVLDGVDVVNYSIGSSAATTDPWNSSSAQQWLNVRNAGIFVATSAGNSGPGDATVGSPGDLPWMTTVGASSHNRAFLNSVIVDEGALELQGLGMTGPLTTAAEIVLAANYVISPTTADDARLCGPDAFPEGTFNGQIVVCERGQYGRVAKGESAAAGGAGGYILAQPAEVGGGPGALASDPHVIPGVHIDYHTYQQLLAYMQNQNTPVMGTITGATLDINDSHADVMASFSSRGPNGGMLPDLIVPNVTAPGRSIWAAYHQGDGGDGDYTFNVIQGTSMSSPHVAGAGALMVAKHGNWTPAQIESALMTTARDTILNDDGINVATPFAQGSGHVDLRAAPHAGLLLDVTTSEFQAANPAQGGDAKSLNISSMGDNQCLGSCSWNRTVSSALEMTQTWSAMVMVADGVTMTGMVDPMSFTLSPGATQELTITVDVSQLPADEWAFAKVVLTPASRDGHVPAAHLPIAVKPTTAILPPSLKIDTRRNAGSVPIKAVRAIEITDLTTSAAMVAAEVTNFEINQDPTNDIDAGEMYDDLSQVFWMTMTVPADSYSLVTEILASQSPDLDMAVGMDSDGDGEPELSEEVCLSAGASWTEFCEVPSPDAGVWWVVVLNWEESAHAPDAVALATAIIPNSGNIWVDGPGAMTAGEEFDVRVYWNAPEMSAGERWYGAITLGSDANNPGNLGTIPVYLNRHQDDVSKSGPDSVAPGEIMTYTIEVQANLSPEDLTYSITDTLPEGTTYIDGSATATAGTVQVTDNTLTWNGLMAVPQREYVMTTSANNPMCDTGFGGYVNLENFGILAKSEFSGDSVDFTAFDTGDPINFYGIDKTGLTFTDDGLIVFDSTLEGVERTNTPLPDANLPNDLLAMYWRDFEIVYDEATNRGVSLATAGDNLILIEYDDLEPAPAGSTSDRFDFQVIMTRAFDDSPGAYEIVYAYDNLVGDLSTGTIGLENKDGTVGLQYAYNDLTSSTLSNGLMICFDWYLPLEPVKITYQVMVDANVSSAITNTLTHNTDNMGSMEATASASTEIDIDADGIGEGTEGNAPNNGDGNNDGIPDNEQANVASLPNSSGHYVTLAAPDGINLTDVEATGNPAADTAPENVDFPQGFFDFGISGITAGDAVSITLILHEGETPESYWKYGPITDTTTSQWYEFNYDGTTGAQINGNTITLHFVDGERGDADLTANGVIKDPGAPAIVQEPTNISLASLDGQVHIIWQQLLLALLLLFIVAGGASLHVWRKAQVRA